MKKYLFVLGCFLGFSAIAQNVVVPNNVYLADLHLKIEESGRREIQKKVDALHKYPVYFKVKVDRADTYFPIIERVFQEEGLPADFKYLALQESGLIGDAVSTSNAVGYWQFKKEAASDQGLRINSYVDERKHIIESSRGAARYLIRNNSYYKNWVNTLLSYMEGFTGAKAYAKPSDAGARTMEITDRTHYYVLTFLAHKIAYENFVGKNPTPQVFLQEVEATPGQSLSDIALSTQIDPLELEKYNKWLVGSAVPGDKKYTVMIPVINEEQELLLASSQAEDGVKTTGAAKGRKGISRTRMVRVNDLKAVIAGKGETKEKMARRGNMSVSKFLRLNELRTDDAIVEGETYFLEGKRNRAAKKYHVAQPGEDIAAVSRKYGVKEKALLAKNRMHPDETLEPGRVVWLQRTRPRSEPVEYRRDSPARSKTVTIARNSPARGDTALPAAPKEQPRQGRIDWRGERERKESSSPAPAMTEESAPAAPRPRSGEKYITADEEDPEFFPMDWSISATEGTTGKKKAPARKPAAASPPGSKPAPVRTSPAPAEPAAAEPAPASEVAPVEPGTAEPEPAEPVEKAVRVEKPKPAPEREPAASPASQPRENNSPGPTRTGPVRSEPARSETVRTKPVPSEPIQTPQPEERTAKPESQPAKPAVVAPERKTPTAAGTHTVAKGETLYSISRQYGHSVADLKEWNHLGEAPVAIGQVLTVAPPAQTSSPTPAATKESAPEKPATAGTGGTVIHKVATGETIYQISRQYGVTIKEVMDWNKKSDFNVKVGENLTIKPKN
jgi:membrane-bound lytic murein transglycosylase D